MSVASVQPLIEAARYLELCAQRNIMGDASFLAACASLRATRARPLPPLIRIAPHETCGAHIPISRARRGSPTATALWPQDGLEAKRFPLLCGVLSGQASLPSAEYSIHAAAGSLIFIPSGIAHPDGSRPHLSGEAETDFCDLFWLYSWEGGLICHICHSRGSIHANFQESENCFLIGRQPTLLFDLLAEAVAAQQSRACGAGGGESATADVALPYLLPALLAVVGEELKAGHYVQPGVLPAEEATASVLARSAKWKEDFGAIMQVQSYVTFHLDQPLSLDDMAQMAFMSRAQFTRRFRQATGCSFVQYLTAVRIERAKQLLHATNWSVETVAQAVGMRPSHFWKAFTHQCNAPPREFRKQSRQSRSKANSGNRKSNFRSESGN
jgi:AraC-like DNA-binding protein